MTYDDLITSGVGFFGVIVGASIPWIREWLTEKQKHKYEARYLAIRIVCVLEEFANKCAEVASDDGSVLGQFPPDYEYVYAQIDEPDALYLPNEINWLSIDTDLMYRTLILPSKYLMTKINVSSYFEFDDPPYFTAAFQNRIEKFSEFGLEISLLSDEYKNKYKIPHYNENTLNSFL